MQEVVLIYTMAPNMGSIHHQALAKPMLPLEIENMNTRCIPVVKGVWAIASSLCE